MAILVGLKNQSTHGTFHGIDGIEGFSMMGTTMSIIKIDDKNSLVNYVNNKISTEKKYVKRKEKLSDMLEICDNDDYDKLLNEYDNLYLKIVLLKFDHLLILEGEHIVPQKI